MSCKIKRKMQKNQIFSSKTTL